MTSRKQSGQVIAGSKGRTGTSGPEANGLEEGAVSGSEVTKSRGNSAVRARSILAPTEVIESDVPLASAQRGLTALPDELNKHEREAIERTKALRTELANR